MQIRITKSVLEHGCVQWLKGQIAILPDEVGQMFVDEGHAVELEEHERLDLSSSHQAAVRIPAHKPKQKPTPKPKGRR